MCVKILALENVSVIQKGLSNPIGSFREILLALWPRYIRRIGEFSSTLYKGDLIMFAQELQVSNNTARAYSAYRAGSTIVLMEALHYRAVTRFFAI
jgi:hypothetical protein